MLERWTCFDSADQAANCPSKRGNSSLKCQATLRNAEQAVKELGIQAEVVKVDDLSEITARGVMVTPALAIDGEIKCSGRIPTVDEIKSWIRS